MEADAEGRDLLVSAQTGSGKTIAYGLAIAETLLEGADNFGPAGDPLALKIFEQQAMAVGRLFTIAAKFTDPHVYFLGGGVVEAAPHFATGFSGGFASTPSCARSR